MIRGWVITMGLLLGALAARGQALEPRFYANAPKNVNFALGGYVFSTGGLSLAPGLAVEDAELDIHTVFAAYARTLDLFGHTAKFDVSVPYIFLDGSATQEGTRITRSTNGMGDPTFRFSYNFYGAPSLTLEEFRAYKQNLVLGATMKIQAPLGQYDKDKGVNIGQNRWAIAPELGLSKRWGRFLFEAAGAVTFYTDNDEFIGKTREQDPLYSAQIHLVYVFKNKMWISLDANRYIGGETTVDGKKNDDEIANSRFGATMSVPVTSRQSVKLYASTGVDTRIGSDFDTFGIAWQYRWGGGL